jgi:hypothetical protein
MFLLRARKFEDGLWCYSVYNERTGVSKIGPCLKCNGHKHSEDANEHYRLFLLQNIIIVPHFLSRCTDKECQYPSCKKSTRGYVIVNHD